MNDFINEYKRLCADHSRKEKFKRSGEDGIRLCSILNTNIKSLQTVGTYIETVYDITEYSDVHKQKFTRLEAYNFRSLNNHNDPRAIIRSDIILAARKAFGEESAFVALLIYLLILDTGSEETIIADRTRKFIKEMPVFLKRRIYAYAHGIGLSGGQFPSDNILQELVVYYGDQGVYREFVDFIVENYPNEDLICENFRNEIAEADSPISQRIRSFQESAVKKDALYAVFFYSLDQFVRETKLKGLKSGETYMDANEFLIGFFDYFNEMNDGYINIYGNKKQKESIDSLKDFVSNDLSPRQREEIHHCICNVFNLYCPE